MKRLVKQDYLNIIGLIAFLMITIFLITGNTFVFGSTLDWQSQHWAFADYFRKLFYETNELFPSFAFNIGGGQNIWNFSYYGLLNPFILLSYFMPFISMPYFIMGAMIVSLIISIILMYKWLVNKFDSNTALIATFIFLCAGPLIFHSHRHIMFISYMPFLLMALIGVDSYFKNNNKTLLIISIFLIIMTSYYFSIGAIIAITIYAIYKYLKTDVISFKTFKDVGAKYALNVLLAILMAAVFLLPTAYALLSGRATGNFDINLAELLTPSLNWNFLLYGSYSLGLTAFFLYSLVENYLNKDLGNKFLVSTFAILMLFPIFVYLLNGTIYISAKVLIPFLPLAILLSAKTINRLLSKQKTTKQADLAYIVLTTLMISLLFITKRYQYIFDFALILLGLNAAKHFNKNYYIIIPIMFLSLKTLFVVNLDDTLMKKIDLTNQLNGPQTQLIDQTLASDQTLYRFVNNYYQLPNVNHISNIDYLTTSVYSSASNNYYSNLYFKKIGNESPYRNNAIIANPNNIIFNTLMGVKYITTPSSNMIGYKLDKTLREHYLYQNNDVFPIGFASSSLMSQNAFNKLTYPYNIEALVKNIVVNKNIPSNNATAIKPVKLDYEADIVNLDIKEENNIYYIEALNNSALTITLKEKLTNKLLLIDFEMLYSETCSNGDTAITINGMKNKLTCATWRYHNQNYNFSYVLSSADLDKLNITFEKGSYEIKNINAYTLDYDVLVDASKKLDPFIINKDLTKGDLIKGSIDVTNDGYFMLSIPYDEGFEVKVDDKLVDYELVNGAFIGFEIKRGQHDIEIKYTAPYLNYGKMISAVSFMVYGFILYRERRRGK